MSDVTNRSSSPRAKDVVCPGWFKLGEACWFPPRSEMSPNPRIRISVLLKSILSAMGFSNWACSASCGAGAAIWPESGDFATGATGGCGDFVSAGEAAFAGDTTWPGIKADEADGAAMYGEEEAGVTSAACCLSASSCLTLA